MSLLTSALTTDLSLPGAMSTTPTSSQRVRFYLPAIAHAFTLSDSPIAVVAPDNVPEGILFHSTDSGAATTAPPPSAVNNKIGSFNNTISPYGRLEIAIALEGNLSRQTVYHVTDNPSGRLPADATDAKGNAIYGNSSYLISTGVYGLTPNQMRNELVWLCMRLKEFGLDREATNGSISSGTATLTTGSNFFESTDVGRIVVISGAGAAGAALRSVITGYTSATQVTIADNASTTVSGSANIHVGMPLYYMYPYWRNATTPHFFRGSIRALSINDEATSLEAYKFTISFLIANVRPKE